MEQRKTKGTVFIGPPCIYMYSIHSTLYRNCDYSSLFKRLNCYRNRLYLL